MPRVEPDLERSGGPTVSQTLNGVTVTGEEIDEIFQLYERQTPLLAHH